MNNYTFAVDFVDNEEVTVEAVDLPAAEKMIEERHTKVLDKTLIDIEEGGGIHPIDCECYYCR